MQSRWFPILMLSASNIFMTFAWYGHLKFKGSKLWIAILASWGVAFFEYRLMVPASRAGSAHNSTTELKSIQEGIAICVFSVFVIFYMGQRLKWNHLAAFACIVGAVYFTFIGRE